MAVTPKQCLVFTVFMLLLAITNSSGQARYRVAPMYEDTVRIAIIWNDADGYSCTNGSLHQPVGEKTRDFVLKALDTSRVDNVKVLINTTSKQVTWADIQNLWGAGTLPHVIVHVNAGWSSGWNTSTLQNTFTQAVNNHIGVVSIGDDAANLSLQTFGFKNVENVPRPLGDGLTIDSLWIGLIRENDDRLKVYDRSGALEYPYVNGIVSNAMDSILSSRNILQFKPRNNGRCQADADRYVAANPQWLTMLGYQQGYLGSAGVQPDRSNDLNVLVAIQDTTSTEVIRRGVAVSFQPQFLRDSVGVQQIVYDAIMFASQAHTLSVPTRLVIRTEDDTLTAGEIDTLFAYLIDQRGDTINDPTKTVRIRWEIRNPHSGDRFVGNDYGARVEFTAIEAYRYVTIYAGYSNTDGSNAVSDSARIWIRPGPADHLVIEGSSTPPYYGDFPIGGEGRVTIGPSQTEVRGYAVLRDYYKNLVALSTDTRWDTLSPFGLVSARSGTASIGEGIISKLGPAGITFVRAIDRPSGFLDTVQVTVSQIQYDSLRIMQYNVVLGRLVRIFSLTMPTTDSTVLYVQGLRTDRLGPPGSGGWENVAGIWSTTPSLRTSPTPPVENQHAWGFSPVDTGHGTITVRLNTGPQTSIPAEFTTGAPRSLELYRAAGSPATLTPHPQPPAVADTVAAGRLYSMLYAKLFDENHYWLPDYQNDNILAQQIRWTVTPILETTLSATNGHSNTLRSTRAYTQVKVKATWNLLSDSILVYIKPDTASHLVIEASPTIRDFNNDDPLNGNSKLVIRSEQSLAYAYAILRDEYGNFVGYSNPTKWSSLDTLVVTSDTALIAIGEGYVQRVADSGFTKVVATDVVKNFRDTIDVELQNIFYKQLRIYLLDNGPKYIDSIKVRTDEKVTLYVEGQRSDNDIWESVIANWSTSGSLKTIGNPPTANLWEVIPDSVGTGWIKVSLLRALPDSVFATFLPGLPGSMALYKQKGNPLAQIPYPVPPAIDTIIAGEKTPLVAAIFDRNGVWLDSYADSLKSLPLITWTIDRVNGSTVLDKLSAKNGYLNSLTPTQAYTTYMITATFDDGVRSFRSQLIVYILPGPAHHLTIENSPNIIGGALYDDQPMEKIEFGLRDTTKTAFAIIRDKYGNFIQHSKSTLWYSLDSLIAKATESVPQFGEGKALRTGTLGTTKVVAVNRLNSALIDTVDLELSEFSYDILRIVVQDSIDITTLTMRSDQDTILQVLGKRSFDGVWVPVTGNWNYTSNNGSLSATELKAWNFSPVDTGFGSIVVTKGTAVPDTVKVRINPGIPAKLVLYPKEGVVPNASNPPYPDPITAIVVIAGTPFPLVAKALDHNDVWLSEYETRLEKDSLIKWRVIELEGNDSSGILEKKTGHKQSFTPVRAYQSVLVAAELQLMDNRVLIDTVKLQIVPGKATQMIIEGSPTVNLHRASPLDTARITDSTTSTRIYAILRDSIGNFVRYSSPTTWGVVNNDTAVSIRNGSITTGEGVVSRKIRDGVVKVFGVDGSGLRDSTVVKMLPYFFRELRIVVNGDTSAASLTMNTNQDTTLTVQGLRSDSLIWVDLDARWENSGNLDIDPAAPGWAHTWAFSPADTGTGWIRVTMDNDAVTKPDTLPVTFTPGPPVTAEIKIITPPEERIAGKPIEVVVTIKNKNGLVPGTYCFDGSNASQVIYTDTVGSGGKPKPFVLLGDDTLWLTEKGKQCFNGGTDTIKVVLYNVSDSLHRISAELGNLRPRTMPFELHPGPLDSLVLEDPSGKPIGDSINLSYPRDHITILAIGYDEYGNRIGPIVSDWGTDSTLHKIDQAKRTNKVIYQASNVTDNEAGYITAVPSDLPDTKISARVFVKIIGPLTRITSAVTRDANGNGYLDQIVLKFSKPVDLPKGYEFKDILIKRGVNVFEVDSVIGTGRGPDSVWVLALQEKQTNEPQTNWVPEVSFGKDVSVNVDSVAVTAVDGAGPVVWKVTKEIKDPDDVSTDEIKVIFSEPVQRATGEGQPLKTTDSVDLLFYVWELTTDAKGNKTYHVLDSMLIGINNMQSVSDRELLFLTMNKKDLAPYHYISIKMVDKDGKPIAPYITDQSDLHNVPELTNQKVRVIISGPAPKLVIGPNPTRPSLNNNVKPGVLQAKNYPEAWKWVKEEGKGALMQFHVILPPDVDTVKGGGVDIAKLKIRCVEKIYDFVGNPVHSAVNENLAASFDVDEKNRLGARQKVSLYWNGYTRSGRPAAPGVYKVVVYIEYKDSRFKKHNTKHIGVLGIAH